MSVTFITSEERKNTSIERYSRGNSIYKLFSKGCSTSFLFEIIFWKDCGFAKAQYSIFKTFWIKGNSTSPDMNQWPQTVCVFSLTVSKEWFWFLNVHFRKLNALLNYQRKINTWSFMVTVQFYVFLLWKVGHLQLWWPNII